MYLFIGVLLVGDFFYFYYFWLITYLLVKNCKLLLVYALEGVYFVVEAILMIS